MNPTRCRIEFLTEEQLQERLRVIQLTPSAYASRYWDKNPETGMYMFVSYISLNIQSSSFSVGKTTKISELPLYQMGVNTFSVSNPSEFIHNAIGKDIPKLSKQTELDCPFDFTSRCTMGRCDCKPKK